MFPNLGMQQKSQLSAESSEDSRKKLMPEEVNQMDQLKQDMMRAPNMMPMGNNGSQGKQMENEEMYLPMPPLLTKNSSTLSQGDLDNRFGNNNFSYFGYDK